MEPCRGDPPPNPWSKKAEAQEAGRQPPSRGHSRSDRGRAGRKPWVEQKPTTACGAQASPSRGGQGLGGGRGLWDCGHVSSLTHEAGSSGPAPPCHQEAQSRQWMRKGLRDHRWHMSAAQQGTGPWNRDRGQEGRAQDQSPRWRLQCQAALSGWGISHSCPLPGPAAEWAEGPPPGDLPLGKDGWRSPQQRVLEDWSTHGPWGGAWSLQIPSAGSCWRSGRGTVGSSPGHGQHPSRPGRPSPGPQLPRLRGTVVWVAPEWLGLGWAQQVFLMATWGAPGTWWPELSP